MYVYPTDKLTIGLGGGCVIGNLNCCDGGRLCWFEGNSGLGDDVGPSPNSAINDMYWKQQIFI